MGNGHTRIMASGGHGDFLPPAGRSCFPGGQHIGAQHAVPLHGINTNGKEETLPLEALFKTWLHELMTGRRRAPMDVQGA
jgi:hypothetical protein